ncbi:MAG: hypothetical protein SGBAC_003718 [Bacillariaceae sp.]
MVIRIPVKREFLEIETEDLLVDAEYGEMGGNSGSDSGRKRSAKIVALIVLAVLVAVFLVQIDSAVSDDVMEESEFVTHKVHGSTFGGSNNLASPGGAKAAAQLAGVAYEDIIVPVSNVGHATPSLNEANIRNLVGHYMHDEHRSPYSSHLYDKPKEFLEEQQEKHLAKMKRVREEWGAWNMRDPSNKTRAAANFDKAPYKDLNATKFPDSSWQVDEEYNKEFLKEAKALVKRMTHAIYAEYGWPIKSDMTQEEKDRHDELWKIHVDPMEKGQPRPLTGIATLTTAGLDGLVRKLLHAMMTHDEFYVVLAGHSAAAGHGNDFMQNRIMTFHRIMEPVFDKLGMRLVSRNMAMGGVGTLQFSLAGGDLFGEADIFDWDSAMTEKGPSVDLFNKQSILSGERVPLIMTEDRFFYNIMEETRGNVYMGQYVVDNNPIFPETTLENSKTIPYAAQWFDQTQEKFNSICWEPRSDYTPETKQSEHPGSQVSWHPGNRHHTWQGRRLALIVLHGLTLALDKWETETSSNGYPLAESHWHVGSEYEAIRDTLRKHISTPKLNKNNEDFRSDCESLYPWIPRICRVQMHGFGMWSPRVLNDFDFLNLIHPAPNGYVPDYPQSNLYSGFDLMPLSQAVPDDEIDVHAVAIATTYPAPNDLDHDYTDGVDDIGSPPTRRYLQQASEAAMNFASEKAMQDERRKLKENEGRLAEDSEIIPGRGWEVHGWDPVNQFCDGSAQSECARTPGNDCLLYGANDKHMDVAGSSRSGWLVFTVPKVQEGIILVRMEWWCFMNGGAHMANSWTEVNDGKTKDTAPYNATRRLHTMEAQVTQESRRLKPTFEQTVPADLEMDFAINGTINTMKYDEWKDYTVEKVKNVAVWPLLNDLEMAEKQWDGAPVEVAIRFRSEEKPNLPFCISHVYYA